MDPRVTQNSPGTHPNPPLPRPVECEVGARRRRRPSAVSSYPLNRLIRRHPPARRPRGRHPRRRQRQRRRSVARSGLLVVRATSSGSARFGAARALHVADCRDASFGEQPRVRRILLERGRRLRAKLLRRTVLRRPLDVVVPAVENRILPLPGAPKGRRRVHSAAARCAADGVTHARPFLVECLSLEAAHTRYLTIPPSFAPSTRRRSPAPPAGGSSTPLPRQRRRRAAQHAQHRREPVARAAVDGDVDILTRRGQAVEEVGAEDDGAVGQRSDGENGWGIVGLRIFEAARVARAADKLGRAFPGGVPAVVRVGEDADRQPRVRGVKAAGGRRRVWVTNIEVDPARRAGRRRARRVGRADGRAVCVRRVHAEDSRMTIGSAAKRRRASAQMD